MAEADGATSLISFGHKRMPGVWGPLFIAWVFWFIGVIPIVGGFLEASFIFLITLWWWIADYRVDMGSSRLMGMAALAFVPCAPASMKWRLTVI